MPVLLTSQASNQIGAKVFVCPLHLSSTMGELPSIKEKVLLRRMNVLNAYHPCSLLLVLAQWEKREIPTLYQSSVANQSLAMFPISRPRYLSQLASLLSSLRINSLS